MNSTERETLAEQASDASFLFRLTDRLYRAQSPLDVYNAALDAITGTLGCSRASVLLFDDTGVIRFVAARCLSEAYKSKLAGHTPWKPGERDPQPIFVSDIDDTDEADWVKETIRAEGIRALAFIPLVAKGGTVGKFMTYYETPRSFTQHERDLAVTIARQVGFSIERALSERARESAEQELRESEERFRLMSEHAPVMIWLADPTGKCLHLNKMLRDFWAVPEDGVASFNYPATIHPEDAPAIGAAMMDAMARRASVSLKGRYRRADGTYRVLQTDARARVSNGEFLGMIGVNIDITEREEAEAARRQAEQHRELLVAELNHRVKNTLTVVQALAHQTFRRTADRERASFEGRLLALARSHDLLTKANWDCVSLAELASSTLQLQDSGDARVTLAGPPILLPARKAVALCMALHELFTNALKYGALSNDKGTISFEWTRADDAAPRLDLSWREQGGPPVLPPGKTGFGSILLERTVKGDLEADFKLEFHPTGVECLISGPLPELRR